jgi:hypothetical protein
MIWLAYSVQHFDVKSLSPPRTINLKKYTTISNFLGVLWLGNESELPPPVSQFRELKWWSRVVFPLLSSMDTRQYSLTLPQLLFIRINPVLSIFLWLHDSFSLNLRIMNFQLLRDVSFADLKCRMKSIHEGPVSSSKYLERSTEWVISEKCPCT